MVSVSLVEDTLFCLLYRVRSAHGEDRSGDQIIQRPAKHIRTPLNHCPGTAGSEICVLLFLLDGLDFQVGYAF